VVHATSGGCTYSGKWEKVCWTPLKTAVLELPLSSQPHESVCTTAADSLVLNVWNYHCKVQNSHVTCLVLRYHSHANTNFTSGDRHGFFEPVGTLLGLLPSCNLFTLVGTDGLNRLGATAAFAKHSTHQLVLRHNGRLNKKGKKGVTGYRVPAIRALNGVTVS